MWPFLCHGRDQVVVEACRPDEIRKVDIVLLHTYLGNYLVHRVTGIKEDRFETTGDGNCFRDGYFPFSCLRARVTRLAVSYTHLRAAFLYERIGFVCLRRTAAGDGG